MELFRLSKPCEKPIDFLHDRPGRIFSDYKCKNNREIFRMNTGESKLLENTWKFLKKMQNEKILVRYQNKIPQERKVEFDYHNHFKQTVCGNYTYIFCFNYGYRSVKDGYEKKDRLK